MKRMRGTHAGGGRGRARLALLAAAAFWCSCEIGSETGNPAKGITGLIRTADGLPAASARVLLVPDGFVPADDRAIGGLRAATTDRQGRFRFAGLDSGRYNLESENPADGARARLAGVLAGDGGDVPTQILATPGSITASLAGAADTVNGFIYVPGSTYRAAVRAANSQVRLDSLPPGLIDSLMYGSTQDGTDPRAFAWDIVVEPDTASAAAGPYLAWRGAAALSLDAPAAGIGRAAELAGFPVRIPLPDSLLAAIRPDGSDLRAANGRGEPLPCEFQAAASGSGAALWVRMDTVAADRPTPLRIYWGYAGTDSLPEAWKPGSVFAPGDGYAGVWHLDQDPASGRLADATGQGNEGTPVGYPATGSLEAGVAGAALRCDGKSQFMGTRQAFDDPETFTFLIWFKAPPSNGGRLLEFSDKDTSKAAYWDRLLHLYADGSLHLGVYPPDTAGKAMPTASSYRIIGTGAGSLYDDGNWHQAAGRLSQSGLTLFVDGERVAHDPSTYRAQIIRGYWRLGYGLRSGWAPSGSGEYFQGSLDECWIAHRALSDDFVKLSYANLKPGSRLIRWP